MLQSQRITDIDQLRIEYQFFLSQSGITANTLILYCQFRTVWLKCQKMHWPVVALPPSFRLQVEVGIYPQIILKLERRLRLARQERNKQCSKGKTNFISPKFRNEHSKWYHNNREFEFQRFPVFNI